MTTESIKSAERTLRVFEYFDRVERPAGVMELAEALGMPRSSAAALIGLLVQMGYLSHDRAARSYMPTMKLAQSGLWVAGALTGNDRNRLMPLLHALAHNVDDTVVLAVQDDLYAQYVHVELAQRPVMYFQRAGARRPMCRSAVGWALLSLQEDDQVRELVQRHNQFAGDKPVDEKELLRGVATARKLGYAFSRQVYMPGVGMIAMPMRSVDGARRYAIGVGGPVDRLAEREKVIEKALRACIKTFLAKPS